MKNRAARTGASECGVCVYELHTEPCFLFFLSRPPTNERKTRCTVCSARRGSRSGQNTSTTLVEPPTCRHTQGIGMGKRLSTSPLPQRRCFVGVEVRQRQTRSSRCDPTESHTACTAAGHPQPSTVSRTTDTSAARRQLASKPHPRMLFPLHENAWGSAGQIKEKCTNNLFCWVFFRHDCAQRNNGCSSLRYKNET